MDGLKSTCVPTLMNTSIVFSESRKVSASYTPEPSISGKKSIQMATVRPSSSLAEPIFTSLGVSSLAAEYISNPPMIHDFYSKRRLGIKHISFSDEQIRNRCIPSSNSSCPDITLVTQLTYWSILSLIRIPFFYYLIQQWSGHISAALALTPKEYVRYSKDFFSFPIPKRVKITLFQLDPSKPFPVNRLRNIAINNIETSHFFYNDIDFVVSGDSSIVG